MTKNQLIYGGIGIVVLAGGAFFLFSNSNKTPELQTQTHNVPSNTPTVNNTDLFANSSLPQSTINELKATNPQLIQQLQNSYQDKPVVNTKSDIVFVPIQEAPMQVYIPNKVQPIDYSKSNIVSVDPVETNRKLAQLQKEAAQKTQARIRQQQQEYIQMYKESSKPDFGNDIKIPKEQLAFLKDIKQKEFDHLMMTLNQILPSHPNKEKLEQQVNQYKDYYSKLQNSINNNNATYGMILKHDEQHKKIVTQVHQIHQSFIGYTNNLYKDHLYKDETDAEYDQKTVRQNNPNQVRVAPPNPSGLNYRTQLPQNPSAAPSMNRPQVAPNPSAAPINPNVNKNNGGINSQIQPNPTGNAFR